MICIFEPSKSSMMFIALFRAMRTSPIIAQQVYPLTMPTTAAPTKPRQRRAKRTPAEPVFTPEGFRELQEMLERLRNLDLPEEDGEPLESDYHMMQIPLLDEVVRQHLGDTGDYFCGGNMFVYFSLAQAQEIVEFLSGRRKKPPSYKGPDFSW